MIAWMTTSVLQGLPSPEALKGLLASHGPKIATWVRALALGTQAAVLDRPRGVESRGCAGR